MKKYKNLKTIKKTGFKTPDNYFDTFDENLLSHLKKIKHIESIGSTGFKVPNGYFDSVENSITSVLKNESNPLVIRLFSKKNWVYLSGIAASLLLFMALITNQKPLSLTNLDEDIVKAYVEENALDYIDIAMLFEYEELEDISIINSTIEAESLENYLIENISYNDLIQTE